MARQDERVVGQRQQPLLDAAHQDLHAAARQVYAATLGPDSVPVGEAVRRIRATYTEEAVVSGAQEGSSATLVAFQVFAHPRLRLRRAG